VEGLAAGKLNTKKLAAEEDCGWRGLYAISGEEVRITWAFFFAINRRRRMMSLGRWPDVSLETARDLATDARRKVRAGIDPIEDDRATRRRTPTFGKAADELIKVEDPRMEVAKIKGAMAATFERLPNPSSRFSSTRSTPPLSSTPSGRSGTQSLRQRHGSGD
jgi:hypothetical protein